MSAEAARDDLEFHMVEGERWRDLARLFEGRGGPKHCWCMVWREAGPNRGRLTNDERKALLAQRVEANIPIGLLAYHEGEPVAWCSVAPRETYRERALGGPDLPGEVVWSIVCFFAQRRLRGEGLGRALLQAAIREATARGATVIEAYPVDPEAPSYRYMGFTSMFRAAGFRELGRAGTRRHVMQLAVGAAPRQASR
jgi:GNAT superfamily N-acetyltransferase